MRLFADLDGDRHANLDPHGNSSCDRDDNRHPYADAFKNFYDFQYADENRHEHGDRMGHFDTDNDHDTYSFNDGHNDRFFYRHANIGSAFVDCDLDGYPYADGQFDSDRYGDFFADEFRDCFGDLDVECNLDHDTVFYFRLYVDRNPDVDRDMDEHVFGYGDPNAQFHSDPDAGLDFDAYIAVDARFHR